MAARGSRVAGTAGGAARAHDRPPAGGGTSALLFATAVAAGGGPACALAWEGGTVLGRLLEQLASFGIGDVRVVTRPELAGAVERALGGEPAATAAVVVSESLAGDLRIAAGAARTATGRVVVGLADAVGHRETFAGLALDPRPHSAILTAANDLGAPYAWPTRSRRGRVVSAGSPFHEVHDRNNTFLGMIKLVPADLDAFARAADRLADLTAAGVPPAWAERLAGLPGRWEAARPDAGEEVELQRAAAAQDATALLFVGLVRSGAFVGNSFVRQVYWGRPLSPAGAERARSEMAGYDEDRARLDAAVKPTDGFFTTFFVSPYSRFIARWAARRGLTPNQVTTVSMLIGVAAAAAFATGQRWGYVAGALLLQAAFTADCVDGQLARYTRTFTRLGAWLDSVFDRSKEYLVFAGLAIGASRSGDPAWLLAGAALTLQTARHTMEFSWSATMHQQMAAGRHPPIEEPLDQAALDARAPDSAPARDAATAPEPQRPRGWRRRLSALIARWTSLDDHPNAIWVKRMIAFPIGERFAVISLMAALTTPRTTLIVVLVCNGFAASYSGAGRVLRSIVR